MYLTRHDSFWWLQQLSGAKLAERDEMLANLEQELLKKEDRLKIVRSQQITLRETVETYRSQVRTSYVQNDLFWEWHS